MVEIEITDYAVLITLIYHYLDGNADNCPSILTEFNNMPLIWDDVEEKCYFSQSAIMLSSITIDENIVCGFTDGCSEEECSEVEFSNNGNTIITNDIEEPFCTDNTDCKINIPIEECNEPDYEINEGNCIFSILNRQ